MAIDSVDFARERSGFPSLSGRTYLAPQCMGPFPEEMLTDLHAYRESLFARSRALDEWAQRWLEMHAMTAALLGAPTETVFLRDSATAAQAAIASALQPLGDRRRIIVGTADFHSSRYLWNAQVRRGFEILEVDTMKAADPTAALLNAVDERVRVVALSLVSPRTGALLDAPSIVAAAKRCGAVVLLDVYQAVGVVPIRALDLGADVLVGGFHKWVGGGGTGLAFGYVSAAFLSTLDPAYPGWLGHQDLLGFRDGFVADTSARRLAQGMVAMEPVYSSRAGVRWVLRCGIDAIRSRSIELTEGVIRRALERGLCVRTPLEAARRGGMVCIDVPDGPRIVEELGREGIDIDTRPGAGVRIGAHVCLDAAECEHAVDRIAAVRGGS